MEIKKWNEIEHSFTSKFGWYDGLRLMVEELRIITKGDRRPFVLKMVSKLMYANMIRKNIINLV